ncbi:MAG: patatin-like phospholipase family protein [Elusimicrobia bacterium]|nr:patatin-like phospholipase family protein [Elusimicrobiota bacterium]
MLRAAAAALLAAALPFFAAASPDLSADGLLRDHLWSEVRRAPAGGRPRVGLVLSAGSLRGTAHVGVLHALEDAGFPVDVVSGTSMGAVIGAMYASGMPLEKIWKYAAAIRVGSGNDLSSARLISLLLFDKLLSSEKTEIQLRKNIGDIRFDQTLKPFACVAMDVYTGEAIIFRDGDVAPAVRASMNLPGIFRPLEYRHRFLVDGGVVDYIPVDAAKLLGAEWTIASVTETDYTTSRPKNVLESLMQVIDIRGSYLSREQRKQADFLIEPPVGDMGMFEDYRTTEAIEKGVIAAAKRLDAAKESLILASISKLAAGWRAKEAGQ